VAQGGRGDPELFGGLGEGEHPLLCRWGVFAFGEEAVLRVSAMSPA
jgi:hypothetical protein